MLAKNCWIVFTLVAATAAGHAAAQGGAVAKGATEPLDFKPADARMGGVHGRPWGQVLQ